MEEALDLSSDRILNDDDDIYIYNFMKIRPVGAEFLMRTDIQTDMTKLIIAFRNFTKALNKP